MATTDPAPPRRRRFSRRFIVVAVAGVVVVLCLVVLAVSVLVIPDPPTELTVSTPITPTSVMFDPVTAAPTTTQNAGPIAVFTDGMYEVGTGNGQVAPGKYRATGHCYWARLGPGGEDDIIDNHYGDGQTFLVVKPSDRYVFVEHCYFTKVPA